MHVPEGWIKEVLGSVSEFKNGLNFTKSDDGEIIKIVGVGDFKGFSELRDTDNLEYVRVANNVRDEELLKSGDLLFVRSNGNKNLIGRCLYFPVVNERLSYSGFTIRGRINPRKILPKYASYLVRSSFVKRQFLQSGGGTNISNLSQQILSEVIFSLPPLPEQQKIAQILSTWDKAIEKLDTLITAKQKRKKALMQQLLTGKKRFAGFGGEWKKIRLGDIAEINSGGTPKSSTHEYYSGDIPWVSIADMTKHGMYIFKTERNISKLGLENSSARMYPRNTILYAMYASIGECSIAKVELTSSQAILGIRPGEELNYLYLYYYLSSLKEQIKLQGQQGTQANLNTGIVKNFILKLPSVEEQQKIASVLSAADKEIETHQKELSALKQQKKGLMQQLLTGKKRVKIDEPVQQAAVGA